MSHRYKIDTNLLTICISIAIICTLFVGAPLLEIVNKNLYAGYLEMRNTYLNDAKLPEIVVVEIDDESLGELGAFPFARSYYAESVKNLQSYSPAVIGFDILFLDPSLEEEDEQIYDMLERSDNIVFGASINSQGEIGQNMFSADSGYLPVRVSALNNTVYSFVPQYTSLDGTTQEHFTLAILRKYYSYFYGNDDYTGIGSFGEEKYIFSPEHEFTLSKAGADDILINYDNDIRITSVPFSATLGKESLESYINPDSLKDAIIIIGPAAEGFGDTFFTPYDRLFGVHIHAHILSTLISKSYLSYMDAFTEWCMIFLVIILAVLINLASKRWVIITGNFIMVFLFLGCIPLLLLGAGNIILRHPAEVAASLIFAFAGANIVKYLIEKGLKKKLGAALSEYVGSSIADEILLEHGKVNLDGETRELVCFFSDIEGFTTLSERLGAASVVAFLREYLAEMTHIIIEKKGHIDKFEGDAVMALWGAFSMYSESDCIQACEAALLQQKALTNISQNNKELLMGKELKVRIGIHEGEAIIGNIGAEGEKMEFTALGDTVNLASRLEGVNKYYGTYICVSEQVYIAAKDTFTFRLLDEIRVQGKNTSVKIYELLGYKKDFSGKDFDLYLRFSKALGQYKKGNFSEAQDLFHILAELGDAPSKIFVRRCYNFQKIPPHDWDGVWNMEGK